MAPDIDGKVYITEFEGIHDASELPTPGTLATIEVTAVKDYDLIGRVTQIHAPTRAASRPPILATNGLFPILASR